MLVLSCGENCDNKFAIINHRQLVESSDGEDDPVTLLENELRQQKRRFRSFLNAIESFNKIERIPRKDRNKAEKRRYTELQHYFKYLEVRSPSCRARLSPPYLHTLISLPTFPRTSVGGKGDPCHPCEAHRKKPTVEADALPRGVRNIFG